MRLAAVEADLDSVTASRNSLQRDLETLREQLAAVEAEAATAAADSFTEQARCPVSRQSCSGATFITARTCHLGRSSEAVSGDVVKHTRR